MGEILDGVVRVTEGKDLTYHRTTLSIISLSKMSEDLKITTPPLANTMSNETDMLEILEDFHGRNPN